MDNKQLDYTEGEEYLRSLQESRRRQLTSRWLKSNERGNAYILLNITENICGESYYEHEPIYEINQSGTAEDFLSGLAKNIASDEHREEFLRRFSMESFEKDLSEDVFIKEIKVPFMQQGRGVHWYKLSSVLSYDSEIGHVEVFFGFEDIDNEIRLNYVVDRMLSVEYEYLGQIDVQSGCLTRIGKSDEDNISEEDNGYIIYQDIYYKAMCKILPAEYWEEGAEAMSLEKIIQELKTNKEYSFIFPVVLDDGRGQRICQWSYEYADTMRSTILMTRRNISTVLDYGYDALTGMYARKGFYEKLREELDAHPNRQYDLLEIDFENFKLVNKDYGFEEGNKFLRRFGADIRQKVKELGNVTCVGHLEADHFVVLFPKDANVSPEEFYKRIAMRISTYPNASRLKPRMGVYEIVDPTLDVEVMCDCVHLANKYCKGSLTKNVEYYSNELRDKVLEEKVLLSEVQNALDTEQFEVWFQPQVNHARNGSLIGAEALVRWNHPERGMISPAIFIPMLEENDAIYELDKYVWRHACQHIRQLMETGAEPLPISVNISRMDIMQEDFLETIVSTVEEQQIPYELIHLEITESAFTDDKDRVVGLVKELTERGFTLAIDDFGSGYSSLSMIKSVPAHILKLDMSFFQNTGDDLRNECVIESIIRMAKMLGMAVLAEGVEDVKQADFLHSVGCNYIQGFLYSRPLPFADFVEYAKRKKFELARNATMKTREEMDTERTQSYELFRNIISGSNDIIIVADIKTKQLLYANHAAERFYSKGFDPMVMMSCSDYCDQKDLCKNCPADDLKLGERKELIHANEDYRMRALYTRMDWNGHDAFVFYQTDISEEMRELELADSLIRNISGAIIVFGVDAEGEPEVRYVSEQAKRVFSLAGVDKEDLVYEDFIDRVHPEDKSRVEEVALQAFSEKKAFREEFRICLNDGAIMWIDFMINPVADKNGIYQFYGIYTDITDRKNEQARVDAIIQSIPTALAIYEVSKDTVSRIFISDGAKKILNVPEAQYDVVGMAEIYGRVYEEDEPWVRDITKESIQQKKPFSIQFRLKDSNRWLQLDSTPIAGETGDCLHYYSVYTDISAQKQLELGILENDTLLNVQETLNLGLREALRMEQTESMIDYVLSFVGKVLHAERAYVIEKNQDGTDSNTFEWVAKGVTSEKNNLQNIPEDVCLPWYEQFKKQGAIIIEDVEKTKFTHPQLYEKLVPQNIHSLIAAPFFNDHGEPMGFLALDNPPEKTMTQNSTLAQNIAFFIEATLKGRNLKRHH